VFQLLLDDGSCRVGVEFTVMSFVDSPDGSPTLLRPSGITLEEIEAVLGPVTVEINEGFRPTSPRQLLGHYSPVTPLTLTDGRVELGAVNQQKKSGC
jgi:L-threonylcarbamoyladenylate synthase